MSKTINIYLNTEERKQLDNLKVKYRVSLTTIADVVTKITFKYFLQNEEKLEGNDKLKKLFKEYLYIKGRKTSIKEPKGYKKEEGGQYITGNTYAQNVSKSRFVTNCLVIYIKKEIKKHIREELAEHYWNDINKELTNRKDEFWNYNDHIRLQRRMLRENKEYFKKALEETK